MTAPLHVPVLADAVVAALAPRDGGRYVDGTFGLGGYAERLLAAADCRVLGIDRDPDAIARADDLVRRFPGRLELRQGRFGALDALAAEAGFLPADGVALDLGVSSPQLDEPARGFSFRFDGPLDMRMEQAGPSAADLIADLPEADLAELIHRYGEERHARRVAAAIVRARAEAPIRATLALAELVRRCVPRAKDGVDPATRTFQALRIAVNDELGELERGLAAAERALAPKGRIAVVSFHSLEDRVVKRWMADASGAGGVSRHLPAGPAARPRLRLVARRPITPDAAEVAANPRARSAKLRVAERLEDAA